MTRLKYEWLNQINPTAHNIRWVVRNQIMIQRVKTQLIRIRIREFCVL